MKQTKLWMTAAILIVSGTVALMTGCADGHDGQKRDGSVIDVKQAAARMMELAADRPEQALQTIDSLCAEGMAAYETDWLRAKVYCQSLEGTRLDSAIAICERLMLLDVARENREYRQDVLETLVNACRRNNDDERILRWTTELVTLFHQNGDETEALRSEAEMGVALTHTGHLHEGLAKIDSVIAALDGKRKFNELDASLIALKRKVGVLMETGCHADVIPVARSMVDRLADYEQHPTDYRDGNYREPADEDRAGYIDFYRNRAYGYLAEAYAWLSVEFRVESGEFATATDSARHYLALYEQSDYGKTQAGRHSIAPTLCLLGETAKMDSIFQDLDEARFRDYEQQMEIEQHKTEVRHTRQIAIGLAVVVVLLLLILFLLFRHHRIIRRKNRVIVEQISENLPRPLPVREGSDYSRGENTMNSSEEVSTPLPHREGPVVGPLGVGQEADEPSALFLQISQAIISQQLYLQPLFDREAAAAHFGISSRRIGTAFTQGSPYKSLPDFIRECRLKHACRLLRDSTMTIADVAAASGFSRTTTFNHDFKEKYELSPSEFRELQEHK